MKKSQSLPEPELNYGTVLITQGRHKGKIGYYDDDECDDKAIVYLGIPFASKYILVKQKYLINTEVKSLALESWIKENPAMAHILGVVS